MALPAADKAAIRAHVDAAQWDEWDDEYDDSFDDLGVVNLDGTADVEGRSPLQFVFAAVSCALLPASRSEKELRLPYNSSDPGCVFV